jgi:hypothetical protein
VKKILFVLASLAIMGCQGDIFPTQYCDMKGKIMVENIPEEPTPNWFDVVPLDLDFNSDGSINMDDLVAALKVFRALEIEESLMITYKNKIYDMIYREMNP